MVCAVLTGMGADGTIGINNLREKKRVTVFAQCEKTCAVYGMPKSVVLAGLAQKEMDLERMAEEIIKNVGVN